MLTAIIQARSASTRLKAKVLADIDGAPMLLRVIERVQVAIPRVVVAMPNQDATVRRLCFDRHVTPFQGSAIDVLDRYYQAAQWHDADPIVRITADCPLIDPAVLTRLLELFATGCYDYASVATGSPGGEMPVHYQGYHGRYPDGYDAEIFSRAALRRAWVEALTPYDREHVTPYIWGHPKSLATSSSQALGTSPPGTNNLFGVGIFRVGHLYAPADYGYLRWTVDTADDLDRVRRAYAALRPMHGPTFGLKEMLTWQGTDAQNINTNRHD